MMDEREVLAPCPICGTPDPWTGSVGDQPIVACSNTDTCPEASCDWAPDEWEERTRAAAALRTQAWEQGRDAALSVAIEGTVYREGVGFVSYIDRIRALTPPPDQMQRAVRKAQSTGAPHDD